MFAETTYGVVPGLALPVRPETSGSPELLAWNAGLAGWLGLDLKSADSAQLAKLFSGHSIPEQLAPKALAYAGHQFGYFVPQLGDGRAALIGEVVGPDEQRYDLQLKGSGRTPFSRGGDGKSALGPVLREYVVSEAMHALGVPTTRALAAVATGERVLREDILPGAVLTRVAAGHLRVGTFEYFASRGDREALRALLDYAVERHYPELQSLPDDVSLAVEFLRAVGEKQAALVAHWMSVGFVHGVMNTDNSTISGETLDYGPCAFLDEFQHDKVFSSIDHRGRYSYSNQAPIAQWNLARLADCLLLIADDGDDQRAALEAIVHAFLDRYEAAYLERMRRKLGLYSVEAGDAELIRDYLDVLEAHGQDYTLSFRSLVDLPTGKEPSSLNEWRQRWRQRLDRELVPSEELRERLRVANPRYIPRNHRIEQAIQEAIAGDLSLFKDLLTVLENPYDEQPRFAHLAAAPAAEERVTQTFCGT